MKVKDSCDCPLMPNHNYGAEYEGGVCDCGAIYDWDSNVWWNTGEVLD